MPLALVAR
ncbi:uncharacterized protein FFMR_06860 [Fusarium fujikuroi]|nr:uncharacterized protein FFMR_06860 [Fusarium fujikuroi]